VVALSRSAAHAGARRRTATGFTLIEVMVVLAIVGTLAGVLGLGLGALSGRDAERAVARLRLVLEASVERAEVRGQPTAFERLADGYRFSAQTTDGRWQPLEEPPMFTETRLPAELRWGAASFAGRALAREAALTFGPTPAAFTLELGGDGAAWRLAGFASGEVWLLAGFASGEGRPLAGGAAR
jgi:general secretion pathway protein H